MFDYTFYASSDVGEDKELARPLRTRQRLSLRGFVRPLELSPIRVKRIVTW